MKIYFSLLSLCALSSATAFVVHPKTVGRPFVSLRSSQSYEDAIRAASGQVSLEQGGPRDTRVTDRGRDVDRSIDRSKSGTLANSRRTREMYNRSKSMQRADDQGPKMQRPSSENIALEDKSVVRIQGQALRTWSFSDHKIEKVSVQLRTDGRPLNADVSLWQGPDNCPHRMQVYVEDGSIRDFNALIGTPGGGNSLAIRNTGFLEFPMDAIVEADTSPEGVESFLREYPESGRTVQGGSVFTLPFEPAVESVRILMRTDGRPMNARVELLQGPNNNKQVMEIYTEDGYARPFFAVLDTPGNGNVVRVVNTATMEFPISVIIEPYVIESMDRRY